MKRILPLTLLLFTLGNTAFAFDPVERQRPDIDYLISELQLDDDQAVQLRSTLEKHIEEMETKHQQNQQSHEQMRIVHEQHREEMFTLLGAEKMYAFENYMRQFRPKRRR